MNELIKITNSRIGNEEINSVNARELHEYLEVQTRFDDWIRTRIEKFNFVENEDYIVFLKNKENISGGRPTKEYTISIDMAKELSMVENNEKGREIRKYFIECEKLLKGIRNNYINGVISDLLPDEIEQRRATAILGKADMIAKHFKLDEVPTILWKQNQLEKAKIDYPHIKQLEIAMDENLYDRTEIYNMFDKKDKQGVKSFLDEVEGDKTFSKNVMYSKNGHSGTHYKFNNNVIITLKSRFKMLNIA